jgi:hypothetical protein
MRIGTNPAKDNNKINVENYHRVVVPVYIPNFDGYFAELFDVFKLCIESLLLTVHQKTRITIYNNNCCEEVKKYIDQKYHESEIIDQVFHSKENLGKINAILASVKGNLEPLITITDADVLFKNNWQEETEKIFIGFPEAGMVSTTPSSKTIKESTANNWFYGFVKGKLFFDKVSDSKAMHLFDLSLGNNKNFYDPIHLDKYLVLQNQAKNCEAVFGCGHFVATLKREVFDKGSNIPSLMKIDGGAEQKFIDYPNERLGYLRLATKGNYTYHMGNKTEPWMYKEFELLKKNNNSGIDFNLIKYKKISNFGTKFGKLINKLMNKQLIKTKILNYFGLNYQGKY